MDIPIAEKNRGELKFEPMDVLIADDDEIFLLTATDTIHYTFDIRSLLRYYVHKGYFTVEGLAVLTGVSQERLSVYIDGLSSSDKESIELAFVGFKEDLENVLPYWACSGETPEKLHKGELIEHIEKIHRS